ncbi:hypothetical protein B0J18DRAFT_419371 [Chaetomium sp. MPI-SDFR-AT-0129]|nr:hypothetical protein B0J18DRAFT_419371 [Chaetomium sp. MPI-SDFR-AT-0129]
MEGKERERGSGIATYLRIISLVALAFCCCFFPTKLNFLPQLLMVRFSLFFVFFLVSRVDGRFSAPTVYVPFLLFSLSFSLSLCLLPCSV